jgi:hypothetical protein
MGVFTYCSRWLVFIRCFWSVFTPVVTISGLFAVNYPHLIPCMPFYFRVPIKAHLRGWGFSPNMPGISVTVFLTVISARRQLALPSSYTTPLNACNGGSDPGGDLITHLNALRSAAFRIPEAVGFHFQYSGNYLIRPRS